MQILKNILFINLLILTGCRVINGTYYDMDDQIDFSFYKTFAWLPDSDTTGIKSVNKITRNTIRNYFSYCMAERGYKGKIDNPDIFLDLVITKSKKQKNSPIKYCEKSSCNYFFLNPFYYPYPNPYYYSLPYVYDYSTDNTYISKREEYPEGAITLNIIDRKLNRLIWTGTVWGDLYDANYDTENLYPSLYNLLDKFPTKGLIKLSQRKK